MSSEPSPLEATVQADVGPGDKTGVYYITICNLPFELSRRELEEWLHRACTTDYIELFRTSTSGWIRLIGIDNFEKAWKHINSVDFKGRSIIASDRNRTEPIKIKELVQRPTHSKNRRPPAPTASCFQNMPPTHSEPQPAAPQYPAAPHGEFYMHGYPQSNAGVSYSADRVATSTYNATPAISHHRTPADSYVAADPWPFYSAGAFHERDYVEQGAAAAGSAGRSSYGGVAYAMPYRSRPGTASHSDIYSNTAETAGSSEYITTEARKILLTSLSKRASPEETSTWIRRKAGLYANEISGIEVPPHDTKKGVRGHAYIVFKSTAAAQGAMALLDQAFFQRRQISARFTIEGVRVDEHVSSLAATPPSRKDAREARDGRPKDHKTKHKEPGTNSHGGHGNDLGKSSAKERKPAEKVWPVIADGSSRR